MQQYIGTKIIKASPMGCPKDVHNLEYEDGYQSWSPTNGMPFGLAIEAMRKGYKVARKGWNGRGIFCELQVPDEHSKMTAPYIFIDSTGLQTDNPDAPKKRVPWLASQTDMLSDDWVIVE